MCNFNTSTYGFETAKRILRISSSTMRKVIDFNLVSASPRGTEQRNEEYSGWDIGYLSAARSRPFTIEDGQKALVCSMGVEEHNALPSPYLDATALEYKDVLDKIRSNVSEETWHQVQDGTLRVTGFWRVSQEDTDFLVSNQSIIVFSWAGFILAGGHIMECVPNVVNQSGGRCFVVKPFDRHDAHLYAHNYLRSRPGPMNKVWSSEELLEEALKLRKS
ncbi:hypothetical protein [Trueperella bialowiezensis]|uniref:Uncharacterized protein n=1 Tax=Trueperella bialowiezensis TaxID=312285 RepID=A0A3S4VSB2_9ACTO|nr:hypothetical protein [Trueperella bialowiezensis]VEI12648.1 Uncharacterised protein [Trueperella bialowiezensis]